MSLDDDADDDVDGIGAPLPPDDRLWRHPSELASLGSGGGTRPSRASTAGRGPAWPVVMVAALVGAALAGGVMAATGALSTEDGERVIEKVAVTPVVSSPIMRGELGVAALADKVGPAVARLMVRTDDGMAQVSAVVFRDDGILLTSAHEVAGATDISVVLQDGRRFEGELVGSDLATDVAVVSIDARHLTVAVFGTSADLEVGSPTIALGSSSSARADPSVTTGVVSATARRLDVDGESLHGMIQTDAPIEAGWSGGPLVDATGTVIGITTDMGGDSTGFGFATPIDLVRRVAQELMTSGKAVHGWLGIEGADLSVSQAEAMGLPGGALVRDVAEGGPAATSGLAPGDVITELGGHLVTSSSALVVAVREHEPGDVITVGYWRRGHHDEATVTIDEHP